MYEVHSGANSTLITRVSEFVANYTGEDFAGSWMLLAHWNQVPAFPGAFATNVR